MCVGDILSAHLTDLFNTILNTGVFPDTWMEGIIVSLYKKGRTKDVNNYRGITLVSHVVKLFTTIVNNRLIEWFAKYNDSKRVFRPLMQFSAYIALLRSI